MKADEILKACRMGGEPTPIKVTVDYDFFRKKFKERGLLNKEVEILFRELEDEELEGVT